ncbi:MAG: hypothetical protein L6R42_007202 [Xanthoria sp. 1 TBL-2021]|nr:MAG: hypothetical protein L6R42_007202 [Xanthoria sp. 1 TBL-2021]
MWRIFDHRKQRTGARVETSFSAQTSSSAKSPHPALGVQRSFDAKILPRRQDVRAVELTRWLDESKSLARNTTQRGKSERARVAHAVSAVLRHLLRTWADPVAVRGLAPDMTLER